MREILQATGLAVAELLCWCSNTEASYDPLLMSLAMGGALLPVVLRVFQFNPLAYEPHSDRV